MASKLEKYLSDNNLCVVIFDDGSGWFAKDTDYKNALNHFNNAADMLNIIKGKTITIIVQSHYPKNKLKEHLEEMQGLIVQSIEG